MGFLKIIASLLETVRGWFTPSTVVPTGALRASGSAMVHLADALIKNTDEWIVGPSSVSRKGMEVGWKGPLANPRTRVHVKMDGAKIHITPPEASLLRESVKRLFELREAK